MSDDHRSWLGGIMYESPREFVRFRGGVLPTWRFSGDGPGLLVQPFMELIVPIGDYVELTVGGNAALALYIRW